MERTIKVTGKGKLSVKPDRIRLTITQSSVEKKYQTAIDESSENKSALTKSLEEIGFDRSDLKTLHFNVNTEYEGYQDENNCWKQRLVGYRYTHRMKLEFEADNAVLGRVIYVLSECTGEPEFSIQYTVSDPEAAKNELLAKAVEDSKEKAKVLSEAAGVKLDEIVSIDYSWGEMEISSRPINAMMLKECSVSATCDESVDLDIEADDIDITDTVTVIWRIQ